MRGRHFFSRKWGWAKDADGEVYCAVGFLCGRNDVLRPLEVGSELDAKVWIGSDLLQDGSV